MPDTMTDDELRPLRPYIVEVIEKREVCVTRLVLAIDEENAKDEALENCWADDVALIQELEKDYPVECEPCPEIDEGPEELDREQLAEILENEPSIGVAFGRWMDLHKPADQEQPAAEPSHLLTDVRYALKQLRDGLTDEPASAFMAMQLRDRMRRAADALQRIDAAATTPPADIFVTVEGGIVQCVDGIPPGVRVIVEDFDTEGADPSELHGSHRGELCARRIHEGKAGQ